MNIPDTINGTFELCGAIFILNHCAALWLSKQARGISLLSTAYFAAWGVWNTYYYPHLNQWMSFIGGIAIVLANCIWIGLIIYVRINEKR